MVDFHFDATDSGAAAATPPRPMRVLVLGLGNRLLGDDAAGPLAIEALADEPTAGPVEIVWRDGGTLGLSLLPEIEAADALLVVDAARFEAPVGEVRRFEGAAMDAQLGGRKRSAHELALGDLLGAAALIGRLPARRALVAVQPASTDVGLALSPEAAAAFPALCAEVRRTLTDWIGPTGGQAPGWADNAVTHRREECVDET